MKKFFIISLSLFFLFDCSYAMKTQDRTSQKDDELTVKGPASPIRIIEDYPGTDPGHQSTLTTKPVPLSKPLIEATQPQKKATFLDYLKAKASPSHRINLPFMPQKSNMPTAQEKYDIKTLYQEEKKRIRSGKQFVETQENLSNKEQEKANLRKLITPVVEQDITQQYQQAVQKNQQSSTSSTILKDLSVKSGQQDSSLQDKYTYIKASKIQERLEAKPSLWEKGKALFLRDKDAKKKVNAQKILAHQKKEFKQLKQDDNKFPLKVIKLEEANQENLLNVLAKQKAARNLIKKDIEKMSFEELNNLEKHLNESSSNTEDDNYSYYKVDEDFIQNLILQKRLEADLEKLSPDELDKLSAGLYHSLSREDIDTEIREKIEDKYKRSLVHYYAKTDIRELPGSDIYYAYRFILNIKDAPVYLKNNIENQIKTIKEELKGNKEKARAFNDQAQLAQRIENIRERLDLDITKYGGRDLYRLQQDLINDLRQNIGIKELNDAINGKIQQINNHLNQYQNKIPDFLQAIFEKNEQAMNSTMDRLHNILQKIIKDLTNNATKAAISKEELEGAVALINDYFDNIIQTENAINYNINYSIANNIYNESSKNIITQIDNRARSLEAEKEKAINLINQAIQEKATGP